jgi:hypothetical protein
VSHPAPGRRVPEVNLLLRDQGPATAGGRRRYVEWALIAVVFLIWAGVGVAIAVLLGWHPDLGP